MSTKGVWRHKYEVDKAKVDFSKQVQELEFNFNILEHHSDYTLAQTVEVTKRVKALNEHLALVASSIFKEEHNV